MKGTQVSCQDEVQDTRFLQKADKRQITQVHVNSLKQAQTAMTGILLGSLVPLTVMGFWEHSWQSVADCAVLVGSWFTGSVYYLAPCPDHAAPVPLFFPPSPGCRCASGVRRASLLYRLTEAEKLSAHSLFSPLLPPLPAHILKGFLCDPVICCAKAMMLFG